MSSTKLSVVDGLEQNIKFNGPQAEYVTALRGQVVNIQCNDGTHNHGSSKVELVDKGDYNAASNYCHIRLVAAHIGGKIYAYATKIEGEVAALIKIAHQDSSIRSVSVENLKEDIEDLSFATSTKEVILGSVDSQGNIFVYQINEFHDELNFTVLLQYNERRDSVGLLGFTNFRLCWCPSVPNPDELDGYDRNLDKPEQMFVVLNSWTAEIYSLARLRARYGNSGIIIQPDSYYAGYTEIKHNSSLVDASFSADGWAIALAYEDGYVKFFKVGNPDAGKFLHECIPHEGKPISSINFIDDKIHYKYCWEFVITGADYNTELKFWSCITWNCMQTINFLVNPRSSIPELYLNASSDLVGKHLIVTDSNNRGIYIIELFKNEEDNVFCASQLAHFLVPAPMLSFVPLKAVPRNFPPHVRCLKLLVIQPEKIRECTITFLPEELMHDSLVVTETIVETETMDEAPEANSIQGMDLHDIGKPLSPKMEMCSTSTQVTEEDLQNNEKAEASFNIET